MKDLYLWSVSLFTFSTFIFQLLAKKCNLVLFWSQPLNYNLLGSLSHNFSLVPINDDSKKKNVQTFLCCLLLLPPFFLKASLGWKWIWLQNICVKTKKRISLHVNTSLKLRWHTHRSEQQVDCNSVGGHFCSNLLLITMMVVKSGNTTTHNI